jgi:hypothetical protein
MALFSECRQCCARIVLDTADIVREGICRQLKRLAWKVAVTFSPANQRPPKTCKSFLSAVNE